MTSAAAPDPRALVEALPAEYDTAIDDAMCDATERGISEDADADAFWAAVYAQVTAR